MNPEPDFTFGDIKQYHFIDQLRKAGFKNEQLLFWITPPFDTEIHWLYQCIWDYDGKEYPGVMKISLMIQSTGNVYFVFFKTWEHRDQRSLKRFDAHFERNQLHADLMSL